MLSLCHYTKYTVLSDDSIRGIVITINVLSLLIAAPVNIITITVIAKVRKLRNQPTYLFIGSVCLADALVATISQPLYITTLLLDSSDEHCTLYIIFFVFGWLSAFGSFIGLNMVTLDRFIYISYPLRYPRYMTRKRSLVLISLTWATALLFSMIPVAWLSIVTQHSLLFAHNFVSWVLVGITYYRIYKKVRTSAVKHSNPFSGCGSTMDEVAAQRQATRTVLAVVLCFAGCWGPWTVLSFMMSIKEQYVADIGAAYSEKTFKIAQSFSLTLGFMSSVCNVFIYTFKNKSLRKEWIKCVCGSLSRRRPSTEGLQNKSNKVVKQ